MKKFNLKKLNPNQSCLTHNTLVECYVGLEHIAETKRYEIYKKLNDEWVLHRSIIYFPDTNHCVMEWKTPNPSKYSWSCETFGHHFVDDICSHCGLVDKQKDFVDIFQSLSKTRQEVIVGLLNLLTKDNVIDRELVKDTIKELLNDQYS